MGDRQPAWVNSAFDEYAGRLPREWRFSLKALPSAPRGKRQSAQLAIQAQGEAILDNLASGEFVIALDERGRQCSSVTLADWLGGWQADGRDVCLVIGGADGLAEAVRSRANLCWSLSSLTLPHGLVRVLLAEQLYRAWSLRAGHPYHRA